MKPTGFKIGNLNVQGLNYKTIMTNDFAIENDLDAICISEHWCREAKIEFNKLDNYELGNKVCKNNI